MPPGAPPAFPGMPPPGAFPGASPFPSPLPGMPGVSGYVTFDFNLVCNPVYSHTPRAPPPGFPMPPGFPTGMMHFIPHPSHARPETHYQALSEMDAGRYLDVPADCEVYLRAAHNIFAGLVSSRED